MNKLVDAYLQYLGEFDVVQKPQMPTFDLTAYNDGEYLSAIDALSADFDRFDDLHVTERFLKGENGDQSR